MTGKATRLYPLPPREIPAQSIYEDLQLPPPGRNDSARPYVIINMVSSVDGKSVICGKAARIGSQTDRQTMRNLRSKADAVMIGAGTLRAERLSLGLEEPPGAVQPLAVILSGTGNVPLESNLIRLPRQVVLVITGDDAPSGSEFHARLRISKSPSGGVDLEEALRKLRTEYGVHVLLVEGGPTLIHRLVSRDLADELFLTFAPKLLGGARALTLLEGPEFVPSRASELELLLVHLSGGELYLRYRL